MSLVTKTEAQHDSRLADITDDRLDQLIDAASDVFNATWDFGSPTPDNVKLAVIEFMAVLNHSQPTVVLSQSRRGYSYNRQVIELKQFIPHNVWLLMRQYRQKRLMTPYGPRMITE